MAENKEIKLHKIDYKDWFLNQKRIPDPQSEEYEAFFDFHKELCLDGFMMGGVYFNPFLYWHTNIWNTEVDILDDKGRISQKYANPYLRDNEWIITNAINEAQKQKKGLAIGGIRRLAKSVLEASYIAWGATFDENSQNVIAGLNAPDIKLITDKIDKGLNFIPEAWKWQRIEDNWKNQVTLGVKTKAGERIPFSSILIRNLDEGNNEEAIAGTKPRKLIIDEGGKGSFLRGLQAAIPGFTTPYGWGCSPIVTFCVCAGTKVWDKQGKLLNIENINKDSGLIGYNGNTIQEQEINILKKPEYKNCYRIHTDNGSFIDCSEDHPLLITRSNLYTQKGGKKLKRATYQNASHVKVKDQMLMPSEVCIFGNEDIKYARELGLLIGDGTYGKRSTPTISVSEKEIFEYLQPITTGFANEYSINEDREFAHIYVTSLKPALIKHGLYGQTKDKKRLPSDLHTFNKQSCAELLGGYFDADGNVYYNKKKNIVRIVLTSIVPELLEEVKYLLLKFGINCCVVKENRNQASFEEYIGQKDHIYRLYINQQQDLQIFKDNIKFLVKEKQDKLSLIKKSKYKKFDCKFEINPLNNKEGYFDSNVLYGLRYTTVTKVECIGSQLVYNLNCGPNHNYLSNGFITRQTGGDMKKFMDAKLLMFDVEAFNFLHYTEEGSKRQHGLFLGHKYRMEAKEPATLDTYLNIKSRELTKVSMLVSNEELADKITDENLERSKKAGDRIAYMKEKMYYPKTVDDIFLNEDTNIYNVEIAKSQKARLLSLERTGTPVILSHDGDKIIHTFTDKLPITNFPLKNNENKDAPIVIYEFPMENPPYGLYTAGCLTPGEKVLTDKGLMNVEDVSLDRKLINIEGKEVDIINLQRYLKEDEDIYTLKLSNTIRTTSFTGEHPIYIAEHKTRPDKTVHESKLDFQFADAKNVEVGQWVRVPNTYINKNEFNISDLWNTVGFRKDRNISSPLHLEDFWWMMGLFLGDGWVNTKKDKIQISFNISEQSHINRFVNITKLIFNRSATKRQRGNCIEVTFACQQLCRFIEMYFGKYSNGKKIPEWAKRIDDNLKYSFIEGYLDADGCIMIDKRHLYSLDFVSINLELLEGFQDIFFSLGYTCGINKLRKEGLMSFPSGKVSKTKVCYQMRLGHNDTVRFRRHFVNPTSHKLLKINLDTLKYKAGRSKKGAFISDNNQYIFFRVKGVTTHKYSGIVYNFECSTNTYLCHHITTHNCDPYRQGKSTYSTSLGAVYIYKRMHEINSEKYQDMFVASYVARPDDKNIWQQQARLLCKYYNARVLCENDEVSFIDYMVSMGDAHLLEKQPEWLKEITPNTTQNRDFGISRAAQKVRDFLHVTFKAYMEEKLHVEKDKEGSVIREELGVKRILDPVLLEEVIQYTEDGNFDRIIAAQLAIAQAVKMNPLHGKIGASGDSRITSLHKGKHGSRLFTSKPAKFMQKRKSKLFT